MEFAPRRRPGRREGFALLASIAEDATSSKTAKGRGGNCRDNAPIESWFTP
jgi:hypothetical protein